MDSDSIPDRDAPGASWWLASGLILTTATQFRLPGSPLGIGELTLLGWLAVVAFKVARRGARLPTSPLLWPLGLFWVIAMVLLTVGSFVAISAGRLELDAAAHDAAALAFSAVLSLTLAASFPRGDGWSLGLRRFGLSAMGLAAFTFLVAFTVRRLGPANFWYGFRLRGWAENPNQLALGVVIAPFVLLAAWRARRTSGRLTALALLFVLPLGIATASDALVLSWLVGATTILTTVLAHALLRVRGRPFALFARFIAAPAIVLLLLAFVGPSVVRFATEEASSVYAMKGQGSVRLTLWRNAALAISDAPFTGWGPGPHSGLRAPYTGEETHNTPLDWGTSSGIPGILLYLALLVALVRRADLAMRPELAGGLAALITFSMFHFVLRQPIFWAGALYLSGPLAPRRVATTAARQEA